MKMAPFDRVADQSSAFRADLKAQGKRRRERLSSLASAPPLRRRNDLLPPLRVEELSLADLVGPARNVRRQEAAQIREVAASIGELGFCDPVLIGSGNTVLNGMIRVEAAKQLGLPRIPCIRVEHLTGSEQRLLRVALNRLGENGAWSLEDLSAPQRATIRNDRLKPEAICSRDVDDNSCSHNESLNCFGRFGNRPNESDH
jgi:ParB/Sulfiredoxin domain